MSNVSRFLIPFFLTSSAVAADYFSEIRFEDRSGRNSLFDSETYGIAYGKYINPNFEVDILFSSILSITSSFFSVEDSFILLNFGMILLIKLNVFSGVILSLITKYDSSMKRSVDITPIFPTYIIKNSFSSYPIVPE